MHIVTGAAGFIGSHLAHKLHSLGESLILVDFKPDALKAKNLEGLEKHVFLDADDVFSANGEIPSLGSDVKGVSAVWHLGANSDTTERNWDHLMHVNVGASQQLWRWCALNNVPYYYASSAATYGDGSKGFSDLTRPEDLTPLNLYGKSKNDFDAWALAQDNAPPHWSGFKFFNVYGAREAHKGRMASMVWKAERDMEKHGRVFLFRSNDPNFADGGQRRDFVWVDDVVEQMLWAMNNKPDSAIYNAGTGRTATFLDMINAYFAARSLKPEVEFIDMPDSLIGQYQNHTLADMSRAKDQGYTRVAQSPETAVPHILAEMELLGWRKS